MSTNRYLNFTLGNEEFAIPLLGVREVIALPEVTEIPHSQKYLSGIMNLRGQVISVMDLRVKLNIQSSAESENTVVIVDYTPYMIGVIVDSILQVLTLGDEEISERPEVESGVSSEFITGVFRKNEKFVLLLDIPKVLELSAYQEASQLLTKAA